MPQKKGQGRGEDAASPRKIDIQEKVRLALELRKQGKTYDEIAEITGYANKGGAQKAVMSALKDITAEPAADVLTLELERLDAMLRGLYPQAITGDSAAVDRVLRIMDRRARYLGLDYRETGAEGTAGVDAWMRNMLGEQR